MLTGLMSGAAPFQIDSALLLYPYMVEGKTPWNTFEGREGEGEFMEVKPS